MKLEDCRNLKVGASVWYNIGNGFRQHAIFKRLVKSTSFGGMTFSDLFSGNFDISKGNEEWKAVVERADDRGKTITEYINPRRLHKVEGGTT